MRFFVKRGEKRAIKSFADCFLRTRGQRDRTAVKVTDERPHAKNKIYAKRI